MKNKILLFLFLLFIFTPTWISLFSSVSEFPKELSSRILSTIASQFICLLLILPSFPLVLEMMTIFNRKQKLKESFGKDITISRNHTCDSLFFPFITQFGEYKVLYKNHLYIVHFENPSNYSTKDILNGKADILDIQDIAEETNIHFRKIENQKELLLLQKEKVQQKIKEITAKHTISS